MFPMLETTYPTKVKNTQRIVTSSRRHSVINRNYNRLLLFVWRIPACTVYSIKFRDETALLERVVEGGKIGIGICPFLRLELNRIPEGRVLPYVGYRGMCRCEGYGFHAVYSRIGYINQSVWV